MFAKFSNVDEIFVFADFVVDSLSPVNLKDVDLTDFQRDCIKHAVYDFMNIFYIVNKL